VEIFTRQWALLVGGGAVVAVAQAVLNTQKPQLGLAMGGFFAAAALVVVAQFLVHAAVSRQAMLREGMASADVPARYGHYLLTSIVVTLGSMLGAILLVVPGIMAILRWSMAINYTLARGMTTGESMAASRDATRGHRWAILGGWVVVWVLAGLPYGVLVWSASGVGALTHLPLFSVLGLARLVWAALVTGVSLAFSLGTFSLLAGKSDRLREVFA
jgi:hypothetical protein